MIDIAVEHLKGLEGEEWEQALTITRTRDRGPIRVVNDPMNVMIIMRFKPEVGYGTPTDIKRRLKERYNMDATNKSIAQAKSMLRLETNREIIRKIVAQGNDESFGDTVRIADLLQDELAWVDVPWKIWVVAEALDTLGYRKKRYADWALWEKV